MNTHFLLALALFTYIFFMFSILIYVFTQRKKAIKDKKLNVSHFQTYKSDGVPEELLVMARHIDNQFQVPVLFLITGCFLLTSTEVSYFMVGLSWIFVVSRMLHTFIHLGSNNVLNRAKSYIVGWIVVLILWIKIIISFL